MNYKTSALICFAGALVCIPCIPYLRELLFTTAVLALFGVYFVFRVWNKR